MYFIYKIINSSFDILRTSRFEKQDTKVQRKRNTDKERIREWKVETDTNTYIHVKQDFKKTVLCSLENCKQHI